MSWLMLWETYFHLQGEHVSEAKVSEAKRVCVSFARFKIMRECLCEFWRVQYYIISWIDSCLVEWAQFEMIAIQLLVRAMCFSIFFTRQYIIIIENVIFNVSFCEFLEFVRVRASSHSQKCDIRSRFAHVPWQWM